MSSMSRWIDAFWSAAFSNYSYFTVCIVRLQINLLLMLNFFKSLTIYVKLLLSLGLYLKMEI